MCHVSLNRRLGTTGVCGMKKGASISDARGAHTSSGLFDLHSQHDYMRLGCRGLSARQEVGPRGHSTPQGTLSDKAFCYGRSASCGVARRDDSQASSWPSWIEALLLRERDEPTDLRGMCAFLHNSSVDLRDLAYLLSGRGRRDLL